MPTRYGTGLYSRSSLSVGAVGVAVIVVVVVAGDVVLCSCFSLSTKIRSLSADKSTSFRVFVSTPRDARAPPGRRGASIHTVFYCKLLFSTGGAAPPTEKLLLS